MTLPTPLRDQIRAVEQAASATDLLLATRALAGRLAEVADAPPDGSELEEAIATLVQVLGFNNPGAAVAAVDGLIALGSPAVEPLLNRLDPRNYGARAWAVRALAGIGDVRGLELLELGLAHCAPDAHPERYELLLHLAMARSGEDPAQAAELYQAAMQLPLPPRLTLAAQLNLAALLVEAGHSDAAAQLCQQATGAAPEVALGWYNLGIAERQRGQIGAAITAYRQALAIDPNYAAAQQNLAVALLLTTARLLRHGELLSLRAHLLQTIERLLAS